MKHDPRQHAWMCPKCLLWHYQSKFLRCQACRRDNRRDWAIRLKWLWRKLAHMIADLELLFANMGSR